MSGSSSPAPSGPTQSQVVNTNIPDYAQPYVMNMLQSAQSQIYQPDGSTFNQYQPYSSNPADYVAGFSPLQQQAQSSAANLQTPGSYGAAQGITGYGIGNALQMGANATPQDFQNQVGGYMNPYIQNTLQPAMQLLNQQYGQQGAAEQGNATKTGAFGGSREALMAGQNQQNQMLAQNQLVGNAYNQAFGAAQNQYNQSGGFALQANQAAMQNANQLAGLGGQQLAAQQSILGTQAQQGALEQQQQQQIINQAVQNYATAQQYPYMQLGVMNSLLRGLPMQASTTQMYQAQPNTAQSAIGLLGAGTALAGAAKRTGGSIKAMAKGGIADVPGYKYGTLINDEQLQSDAQGLSQPQMQQRLQDPQVTPNERMMFQGVQADQNRLRQIPGAGQAIASAGLPPQPQMGASAPPQMGQQPIPMDARLSGIAQGGGPAFASMNSPTRMQAGGITHFANTGAVEDPSPTSYAPGTPFIDPKLAQNKLTNEQMERLAANPTVNLTPRQQAAQAASRQEGPKTVPADFPPELDYAQAKARSDFEQQAIAQGARPKPREFPNPQLTDEQRIAGFTNALNAPPPNVALKPAPGTETLKTEQDVAKAAQAQAAAKAAQQAQANPANLQRGNTITPGAGIGIHPQQQTEEEYTLAKAMQQRDDALRSKGIEPGVGVKSKEAMALLAKQQAGLGEKEDFNKRLAIAQGFLDFAQRPNVGKGIAGMLAPAAHAVGVGATAYAEAKNAASAAELANANAQAALEASDRKFAEGDIDGATKSYDEYRRSKMSADSAANVATIQGQYHVAAQHAANTATAHQQQLMDIWLARPENKGKDRVDAYQAIAPMAKDPQTQILTEKLALAQRKEADKFLEGSQEYSNLMRAAKKDPTKKAAVDAFREKTYRDYGVNSTAAPSNKVVPFDQLS